MTRQQQMTAESLLDLVREVVKNKLEDYKDSLSDGIRCGVPEESPEDREARLAEVVVKLITE